MKNILLINIIGWLMIIFSVIGIALIMSYSTNASGFFALLLVIPASIGVALTGIRKSNTNEND